MLVVNLVRDARFESIGVRDGFENIWVRDAWFESKARDESKRLEISKVGFE